MSDNKPNTKRRQAQFKGPTSSEDYNSMVEENYRDLSLLINRSNLAKKDLRTLNTRLFRQHIELHSIINDLEDRIAALENDTAFLAFGDSTHIDTDTLDGTPYEIPSSDRLSLDTRHNLLTLPKVESSSLSRLFFVDDKGNDYIPGSMEPRVVGNENTADDSSATVDTSSVEDAILRNPGHVWQRNIVVDSVHAEGAEVTLYIRVPTNLFSVSNTNAVVLHPFPAFGVTVRDVSYSLAAQPVLNDNDNYVPLNEDGIHSGNTKAVGWIPPGGWTGGDENDDYAMNAGPRIYYHPPKSITALKVTLHQPNAYQDGGNYVYTYGLSRLDVRKDKFLNEGSAIVKFDAPDGQTISSVDNVIPHIWNVAETDQSDMFEYRVLWQDGQGNFTTNIQQNSDSVWLDITLKNTAGWTPALSGLEVEFSQ